MPTIYLIDGTNYIFRAYYAIRHLSTSKGFPTNALFGFTQMLLKLIKDEMPTHIAIVFDSGKPSFRDEIYAQYKANRKEPPDDLQEQFPYFKKIVDALNLPTLAVEGVEADDVIGTLAKKAARSGYDAVIVTGDKDFMQLVDDKITLLDTMKEKRSGVKEVIEKFGVPPEGVIELMGLAGDTSDNIPGVQSIGPKTAMKLIERYKTIDGLLSHLNELDSPLKEKLQNHAGDAALSKKLATIKTDLDLKFDPPSFEMRSPNEPVLRELLKELEFSKLLKMLTPHEGISRENYETISSEADLERLLRHLSAAPPSATPPSATPPSAAPRFAFDIETTSLNPMEAEIVGLSFAWAPGEAAYIPIGHNYLTCPPQLSQKLVLDKLRPILKDPRIQKIGQNCKYDLAVLAKYGIEVCPIECDTMIASYVLNPAGAHGLKDMANQFLDHTMKTYKEMVGKGKKAINFSEVDIEQASQYACEDADVTFRLRDLLLPKIAGAQYLFSNIEMPLMHVLLKMELAGVKIDTGRLDELGQQWKGELKKLEGEIYKEAGDVFNINSPRQLGVILFERLGLSGARRTKTGYSTDVDVLTSLAERHKLPGLVLAHRSLSKLVSTYVEALPKLVNPRTGRIHTDFNQTVAETGRLSSSEPNLQNIPVRTTEGNKIREAFIAEDGFKLLSADYSQIELRILAHITEEEALLQAFKDGVDVHAATAASIFGVASVSKEQRAVGKTVNFATIYGQTSYGLSKQLGIPQDVAREYIDNYFARYPAVAGFKEAAIESARKLGFVETLLGRRRYVPDINSKNVSVRQNAERMAFNTIFQGSAADIIKKAMIEVDRDLGRVSPQSRMILQVHDELLFEVPEGDIDKIKEFVKEKMEGAYPLKVPLVVDIGVGSNWAGVWSN